MSLSETLHHFPGYQSTKQRAKMQSKQAMKSLPGPGHFGVVHEQAGMFFLPLIDFFALLAPGLFG